MLATVIDALQNIREADFPQLNLDLIYGIEGQTVDSFIYSLTTALTYRPDELFIYPLYVRRVHVSMYAQRMTCVMLFTGQLVNCWWSRDLCRLPCVALLNGKQWNWSSPVAMKPCCPVVPGTELSGRFTLCHSIRCAAGSHSRRDRPLYPDC